MTSPILYLVAVLTGIVISKYRSDRDIQYLEDYNSNLQDVIDETQEKLNVATERLSKLLEESKENTNTCSELD
jgi:hypothetical protein